jgi:hypothetical protein
MSPIHLYLCASGITDLQPDVPFAPPAPMAHMAKQQLAVFSYLEDKSYLVGSGILASDLECGREFVFLLSSLPGVFGEVEPPRCRLATKSRG